MRHNHNLTRFCLSSGGQLNFEGGEIDNHTIDNIDHHSVSINRDSSTVENQATLSA